MDKETLQAVRRMREMSEGEIYTDYVRKRMGEANGKGFEQWEAVLFEAFSQAVEIAEEMVDKLPYHRESNILDASALDYGEIYLFIDKYSGVDDPDDEVVPDHERTQPYTALLVRPIMPDEYRGMYVPEGAISFNNDGTLPKLFVKQEGLDAIAQEVFNSLETLTTIKVGFESLPSQVH